MRRVVVTGVGPVSSIGRGRSAFWQALLAGTCGIRPVASFDVSAYRVTLGGEIQGYEPLPELASRLGRASRLAVEAARLAWEDAGLGREDATGAAVFMGTTSGEPREVEALDDAWMAGEPLDGGRFWDCYPCHRLATAIADDLGADGPVGMVPTACAAGNYAAASALDAIRWGRAEVALAGGSDAFSRITYTGFARLGAIASEACRPFDRERDGMVPAEGAGVLVLESEARARRRGAPIYAEVLGYGLSCDAHHMTAAHPEGRGASDAMRLGLAEARLDAEAIDYVSAHGTGTPTNDRLETLALEAVFGDRLPSVPVSSIKSMLGHTMGAASALESIVCCLAIDQGAVPPTIGYRTPDPECALDCVPNQAREMTVRHAMNNASAFGGNNACVVFGAVEAAG